MLSDDYTIEVVHWDTHRDTLRFIRDRVFIEEQQVPATIEIDGRDQNAAHFLLSHKGKALGCGRLMEDAKITRLALLPEFRGSGLGAALLDFIVEHARSLGHARVYLHAQDHAIGIYQRAGFNVEGDGFEEAEIPHHAMSLVFDHITADHFIGGVSYPEPFATLAIQLAATATRQLRIFSPQLDHEVFNRQEMSDAIAHVARNSRHSDIRILISNSKPIVHHGHRLLTLARRLPSLVHIQKLTDHPELPDYSFVVRDIDGTIYKPNDADREGFYEPDSRASAKRFVDQFDDLWIRSRPDPELRMLGL